jgi:hypothetical protein
MDFKARELRFGFKDRDQFDGEAVQRAPQGQGFAGVELLSGP